MTFERLTLGAPFPELVEEEHLVRYEWASLFVANRRVLDVACGTGYGARMLSEAGARHVVGLDRDHAVVDRATAQYGCEAVQFVTGDAEELNELATDSFDVAVSFETIEHLSRPERFIKSVARVLGPGGALLLSTPDRRLASVLGPLRGRPHNHHHVHEFVLDELLELLRPEFESIEVLGQAFVPSLLAFWPIQVAVKGIGYGLGSQGGRRWVQKHYLRASGLAVQPRRPGIARFWILRCIKNASASRRE